MSQTADEQTAIVTTLRALPSLAGATINAAVATKDVFELSKDRQANVYVVYGGFARRGDQLVGNHGAQSQGPTLWYIIGVANDYKTPTEVQTKTLGALELAEGIRDVRGINIHGLMLPPMYLVLVKEELVEGVRTPRGGQIAYVCQYESSYHRV